MKIDWDTTGVRLNSSGRVRCGRGWSLDPSWSRRLRDFDLWFVSEGSGQMRMRQGTIALRPGLCFWMRPGGLYDATQKLDDRLTVSYAHFDLLEGTGEMAKVRSMDRPLPPEVFTPQDVNLVDTLLRRVASHVTPQGQTQGTSHEARPSYDLATLTLFRGLLMELDATTDTPEGRMEGSTAVGVTGTQRHYRQLIHTAAMRITERPSQNHRVADMAREAGYSPDHFARIFKQIVGVSPQAYVIRVRIDRARQLLVESSLSISQIADVLGYEDLFFFSRQFKSRTGKTPRQYRTMGR